MIILLNDTIRVRRGDVKYPLSCVDQTNKEYNCSGYEIYSPCIISALNRFEMTMNVILKSINTQIKFQKVNTLNMESNLTLLDFNAQTITTYKADDPLTVVKTKSLAFTPVTNKPYQLKFYRNGFIMGVSITDGVNSDSLECSYQVTGETNVGIMLGIPIIKIKGHIYISNSFISTSYNQAPRLAAIGDSITACTALIGVGDSDYVYPNSWHKGWVYLLQNMGVDIVIAGWGGERPAETQTRFAFDMESFNPDYVHLMIGTNATSYAEWWDVYQDLINRILALGATPILGTLPPYASKQALINSINTQIRTLTSYPIVDYSVLLSVDGLGQTWKTEYLLDGIHPNVAGNLDMKNLLVATVPGILP